MIDLSDVAELVRALGYGVATVGDDELEVQLSGDAPDQHRATAVRLAGVPDGEARMLTISTSYEFGAGNGNADDLRLAAAEATQYLVLGHYEVDDDGSLHLRYSMLLDSAAPLPVEAVGQTIAIIDHQQLRFGDYLELVCNGQQTLAGFAELVAVGEASGI